MRAELQRIFDQYGAAREQTFAGDELANFIRGPLATEFRDAVAASYPEFIWHGSAGAGNWAGGPWLSAFDPAITDSSVFNEKFDFFFARSVWTHVSKTQIEIMLDAFARDGADDAVFLTSYHPAGYHSRFFQSVPSWILSGFRRPEYLGEEYVNAAFHGFKWVQAQCSKRGLVAEELKPGFYNTQQWLMITEQSRSNSHDLWERSDASRRLRASLG